MVYVERVASVIRLAGRNHGVITRAQIVRTGASDKVIAGLVRAGTLRRLHRGVFVLAGTPTNHQTAVRAAMAAVGPGALASHRSAAWLAGFIDRPPAQVHLTKTTWCAWRAPGVTVHRASGPLRRRYFQDIPCTDASRVLVDLALSASAAELALAADRALAEGAVRLVDLHRELSGPPRRGLGALRRCLLHRGDFCAPDASVLEAQMARLFVRCGMPVPRAEVHAGEGGCYRIDYAYDDRQLSIELNSYTWHHSPEQMRSDLARQNALVLRGWVVLTYTWRDVLFDGKRVMADILQAYERRLRR